MAVATPTLEPGHPPAEPSRAPTIGMGKKALMAATGFVSRMRFYEAVPARGE